jgi:spore germination cell wall hydrolase CwlJ-like protein
MRWALSIKVALVLVLASPGLLSPTLASAAPPPATGAVLPFIMAADGDRDLAIDCLADAIYYEAGFEPDDGQRAVAQVVLNRVRDPNFPNTVCGVVYQGWQRKTGCQFSFVCDGSLTRRPPDADQLEQARRVAKDALNGYVVEAVGAATHYHTDYVDPYWAPTLVEVAEIGQHIFYKWPGHAGEPEALDAPYRGGEARDWASIHRFRGRV